MLSFTQNSVTTVFMSWAMRLFFFNHSIYVFNILQIFFFSQWHLKNRSLCSLFLFSRFHRHFYWSGFSEVSLYFAMEGTVKTFAKLTGNVQTSACACVCVCWCLEFLEMSPLSRILGLFSVCLSPTGDLRYLTRPKTVCTHGSCVSHLVCSSTHTGV